MRTGNARQIRSFRARRRVHRHLKVQRLALRFLFVIGVNTFLDASHKLLARVFPHALSFPEIREHISLYLDSKIEKHVIKRYVKILCFGPEWIKTNPARTLFDFICTLR